MIQIRVNEVFAEPLSEVELLIRAKGDKLSQIESDYTAAELQTVSYLGFNFAGGAESVASIDGYVRLNRLAGVTVHNIWDTNGTEHSLTEAEVDGLILAIGGQTSINKFTKKNRKLALLAATSIIEVDVI